MSDHLPECPMLHEQYPKHPLENCDYCVMLRACEQRVRDQHLAKWEIKYLANDERSKGYAAGLDAARDAVADEAYTAPFGADDEAGWIDRQSALAAIDALRGDK